jgi:hypothetical protein
MLKYLAWTSPVLIVLLCALFFVGGVLTQRHQEEEDIRILRERHKEDLEHMAQHRDIAIKDAKLYEGLCLELKEKLDAKEGGKQ